LLRLESDRIHHKIAHIHSKQRRRQGRARRKQGRKEEKKGGASKEANIKKQTQERIRSKGNNREQGRTWKAKQKEAQQMERHEIVREVLGIC
jgi:hypothetical protein